MGTTIALMGGTFNPIHNGHLKMARAVMKAFSPERFFLLPAGLPPHKELPAGSPGAAERLLMLKAALCELPGAEICDIELNRKGKSYTVDTLKELKDRYPEAQFLLVMGADMLLSFEEWRCFEEILSLCTIVAACRDAGQWEKLSSYRDKLVREYGASIELLKFPPFIISSSEIRERAGRGEEIAPFVPQGVYQFIQDNKLYQKREGQHDGTDADD